MILKLLWAQKRMFWAFEKGIFRFFFKLLSDKVETIAWESEPKWEKLFKSKLGHIKHLRK